MLLPDDDSYREMLEEFGDYKKVAANDVTNKLESDCKSVKSNFWSCTGCGFYHKGKFAFSQVCGGRDINANSTFGCGLPREESLQKQRANMPCTDGDLCRYFRNGNCR